MDYSYIEGTRFYNNGQLERVEYKWVGTSPYVHVSKELLESTKWDVPEKRLRIGGYKLVVIEREFWRDCYLCVRVNNWFSWLLVYWQPTKRILETVYRRSIITLAVWGLARWDRNAIPSASDIYLVQRIKGIYATFGKGKLDKKGS